MGIDMARKTLKAYMLRLQLQAIEPIELDEHPGSALRGAFFRALWGRFCARQEEKTCAACPLVQACPVSALVAPLRDEHPRGRDIPRPFVLAPPEFPTREEQAKHLAALAAHGKPFASYFPASGYERLSWGARVEPEGSFSFGLTIFGTMVKLLPYVVQSALVMEAWGVGRPLRENGGRRGRFQVERIALVDPFGGRTQALYQRGTPRVAKPELAITARQVRARARRLPTDELTLHFLTPTRLIATGQLIHHPHLPTLVARLTERFDALTHEYGEYGEYGEDGEDEADGARISDSLPESPVNESAKTGSLAGNMVETDEDDPRRRAKALLEAASHIQLAEDETRWKDVASYSSRQRRATPIGGFVGRAVYAGEFPLALRELLVWGEALHVGKNVVKGDGLYRIAVG